MRERLANLVGSLDRWCASYPKRLRALGLALSVGMALRFGYPITPMTLAESEWEIARKEDAHNLYYAAKNAEWSDAPGWFVGRWLYPDVGYYRPLTSLLFVAEQRLFDKDFHRYNLVSLSLHAANAALLFLLAAGLFSGCKRGRYPLALAAVYWFATPSNTLAFGAGKCLHWFPAQNDVLSLTFALASLLVLDRYLTGGRRGYLCLSLLLFYASVGTKEMGFVVAPMALLLIHHRRGFAWKTALPFALLALGLWIMRKLTMATWDPPIMDLRLFRKLVDAWGGPVLRPTLSADWAPFFGLLFAAVAAWIAIWRRTHLAWACLACVVGYAVGHELGDRGSWGIVLLPEGLTRLFRGLLYLCAWFLAFRYARRELLFLAGGWMLLSFLPILNFGGAHYYYWPGAYLALADAATLALLPAAWRELSSRCAWRLSNLKFGWSRRAGISQA